MAVANNFPEEIPVTVNVAIFSEDSSIINRGYSFNMTIPARSVNTEYFFTPPDRDPLVLPINEKLYRIFLKISIDMDSWGMDRLVVIFLRLSL